MSASKWCDVPMFDLPAAPPRPSRFPIPLHLPGGTVNVSVVGAVALTDALAMLAGQIQTDPGTVCARGHVITGQAGISVRAATVYTSLVTATASNWEGIPVDVALTSRALVPLPRNAFDYPGHGPVYLHTTDDNGDQNTAFALTVGAHTYGPMSADQMVTTTTRAYQAATASLDALSTHDLPGQVTA